MSNGHNVNPEGGPPPRPVWWAITTGIIVLFLAPAAYNALFSLPPRVSAIETSHQAIVRDMQRIDNQNHDSKIGYLEGKTDEIKGRVDKLESRLDSHIMAKQ